LGGTRARRRGSGRLRGPRGRRRRSTEGHHGARARTVRYEGRGDLSFAIVRRALGTSLALLIGAAGPALGQFAPAGTGGVAALAGALKRRGGAERAHRVGA